MSSIQVKETVKPVLKDKMFDCCKLKADKINLTQILKFVFERLQNTCTYIVGKGENAGYQRNAGYQHFLLLPQFF